MPKTNSAKKRALQCNILSRTKKKSLGPELGTVPVEASRQFPASQKKSPTSRKGDDPAVIRILEAKNFYELLQVPEDARDEDIKAAYKKMALILHPDKNKSPSAHKAFCAMSNASAVLMEKRKRQEYDQFLKEQKLGAKRKLDEFNLSRAEAEAILTAATIIGGGIILGLGLKMLYDWWQDNKKKEDSRR